MGGTYCGGDSDGGATERMRGYLYKNCNGICSIKQQTAYSFFCNLMNSYGIQ